MDQLAAGSQPGPLSGSRRHLAGDAGTKRGQRDGRKSCRPRRGNRRPAAPYARAVFKVCGRHRGGAVRAVDHRKTRASPAQAQISAAPESLTRSSDANVAASIVHSKEWLVQREPYTFNETRAITLWKPESGSSQDYGGIPTVRVALAYGLQPEEV